MKVLHGNRPKAIASSGILVLVLLAFALKGLLPAGFMPSVSQDGFMEMVICSGMGEKTVLVPANGGPDAPDHKESTDTVCAYQMVSAQKLISAPPAFLLPLPVFAPAPNTARAETGILSSIRISFAARGPPSFV